MSNREQLTDDSERFHVIHPNVDLHQTKLQKEADSLWLPLKKKEISAQK